MAEIVPYSNWERELAVIKRQIDSRTSFYLHSGGKPDPRPFNAQELIRSLERIEPELRKRAAAEIAGQAVSEIERIARRFGS